MKVQVQSKKGLKTILSIIIDKSEIKKKLDSRLIELQKEIDLKGFRKGKVPPTVIKRQFGKAIYGEVIDKILKESTTKAIQDKKFKVAGQPKIDLKTFGEGKDLNFELQLDLLPDIKLEALDKFKVTDYSVKVDKKELDQRLENLTNEYKSFEEKKDGMKAELGDQIIFNYHATVDAKDFEGGNGDGVTIELGKDLFLKGFDAQLVGLKKGDKKKVSSTMPKNHPKKELANKEAIFNCEIKNIKSPKKSNLDDNFAKTLGAKNLIDLTDKVKNQISSQYNTALNSISKKEILEQLEKNHKVEIPKNLIENEIKSIPKNPNTNNNENNIKLAEKRIKLGLILNEYGETNKIKVTEDEIKNEIQKQVKSMPGQEKFVFEYYQKNPAATQHLQSSLYEEKIINFIKSKINLIKKDLSIKEAEKMITDFNEKNKVKTSPSAKKRETKPLKSKKISKK
jgi:trigger factor